MGDTTTDTTFTERRITLRVPSILAARMDKAVTLKQAEIRKYSQNDWIVEAIRAMIDGPQFQIGGTVWLDKEYPSEEEGK